MKKILLPLLIMLLAASCGTESNNVNVVDKNAIAQWAPVGDHIRTRWASQVDPVAPLPEYPRPQLVRKEWRSLNGLWDYAISLGGEETMPEPDGKILVPFCVESALSGVGRTLTPDDALWYKTSFKLPKEWKGQQIWLNFEAIDARASLWVNGKPFEGRFATEYSASSLNITELLNDGPLQEIVLKVTDPTDSELHPRGKQVLNPEGIWYTAVSGIWQSVWIEPTPTTAKIIGYDAVAKGIDGKIVVKVNSSDIRGDEDIVVRLRDGETTVASIKCNSVIEANLEVENPKLWSPEEPNLYDLDIVLKRDDEVLDWVVGYAAFREVKEIVDSQGKKRMSLNGKPYFHFGPLDQGWWPDGLYTAPTDEALRYDIEQTKAMGYNMIRKHVKVEPARWYYWADKLGILVWQDMPSIGESTHWEMWKWADDDTAEWAKGGAMPTPGRGRMPRESFMFNRSYLTPWRSIIDQHKCFPSIVVWVPFNEAWGQQNTRMVVQLTNRQDPTRLVNSASGGNSIKGVGDIFDSHNYPNPKMKFWSDGEQIDVLGEYGGIGWAVEGHLWNPDRNWGYVKYQSSEEVLDQYSKYAQELKETIAQGCAAAVYTQTTDVEMEVNGLMTYDREITKMDIEKLRKINQDVIEFANKIK